MSNRCEWTPEQVAGTEEELDAAIASKQGQSALVRAYFELVDASGLSDEEFSERTEAAADKS